MCAIVGMLGYRAVGPDLYDALTVLQHRGQDAAGILTSQYGSVYLKKDNGLVRDVFNSNDIHNLKGNIGIGHTRYPTAGSSNEIEAQPFFVNSPYGIAMAHNGNLTNAHSLRQLLYNEDRRHINTNSDSEILLNVFAHELQILGNLKVKPDDVFQAIKQLHSRCHGAYSAVTFICGFGLVAFRDPHGIRPLVYGQRETKDGIEHMVASESVALVSLGFEVVRDINPGEAICFTESGEVISQLCSDEAVIHTPCMFEYVYFARQDSIIDDISVYKARLRMGERLADKIQREWPEHDIDAVIPIPDTSRTAALPLAYRLGVKFREGFVKNNYIGRTFIMPDQTERERSVRRKLNPIDLELRNKNVLLIDDSIVRGTTSREIIQMARDQGAKKVYFASAAPPVRFPNVYGIDMPFSKDLIAHGKTDQEICDSLGADRLFYQDLDDLVSSASEGNSNIKQFELSVFTGEYVTGNIDAAYIEQLEKSRHMT